MLGHGAQQFAALVALLETLQGLQVIEQERQVEHLELLGIGLELGQRGGQHLHLVGAQGLDLVGVAEQRRVGVDLDLDLARQTLLGKLLEQQRPLALGRVVGDHMGELDHDRAGVLGMGDGGNGEQCGERHTDKRLEHRCTCAMATTSPATARTGLVRVTVTARSGEGARPGATGS